MHIQVLPGIKPHTAGWAEKLLRELALPDTTSTIQHYLHWQEEASAQELALDEELERLAGMKMGLLVGNSLGVILGLAATAQGLIVPEKAVFIGTPVSTFAEHQLDLEELNRAATMPTLYIQQKDDIVGSAASLREHLGADAVIVEIPGNNHQYKDLKLLVRHIRSWLTA